MCLEEKRLDPESHLNFVCMGVWGHTFKTDPPQTKLAYSSMNTDYER